MSTESSFRGAELPEPKDLSHHLSRSTKNRGVSNIKGFYKYFSIPGIGQLAGGLPNQDYFPFDTLEASVALPNRWKPTPNKPVKPPSKTHVDNGLSSSSSLPSSHLLVPKDSKNPDRLRKIDLVTALQYGTSQGYPPLYNFLRQFTRENLYPNIPYKDGPEIILTCGSTDGFAKAIQALSNEWSDEVNDATEKEGLLCEEYAYMNAIQTARPKGLNIVPVGMDDQGMRAYGKGGLQDVLETWDLARGKRPHLMYTVTIGQNPTSGTLSLRRRKEIYALCQKYDIVIIEDDPYWYLQYPSALSHRPKQAEEDEEFRSRSTGFAFLDSLVPSYLSVDVEGRVIRLDTFSKTIAPGCRLGWVTAQPALIERLQRITETSTQQPSGFVQSMVAELIVGPQSGKDGGRGGMKDGSGWKVDGWVRWLEGLRGNYERRMNTMCGILESGKYQAQGAARMAMEADDWCVVDAPKMFDFTWPTGGMFVWVEMKLGSHPLHGKVEDSRLSRALWVLWTTKPYLVLVSPGTIFAPTEEIRKARAWSFFRLCFAAVDEADLAGISRRFVDGVERFWAIKRTEEIDELLKDEEEQEQEQEQEGAWERCSQSLTGPC